MDILTNNNEILIELLIRTDRQNFWVLYNTFENSLNSPFVLQKLQELYSLPTTPKTFGDFIFEYDIRHSQWRKQLCLKPNRILRYAIKSQDVKLVKELLDEGSGFILDVLHSVGKTGNAEIIDVMLKHDDEYDIEFQLSTGILQGLAFKCHNTLLNHYLEIYIHELETEYGEDFEDTLGATYESIATDAAEGHNNEIAKKFYTPKRRDDILIGASKGANSSLLEWLAPFTQDDYTQLVTGSLQGNHLSNAQEYYSMIISPENLEWLINPAIESDNPEALKWIEKVHGTFSKLTLRNILDKARGKHIEILKYLLSNRYEDLPESRASIYDFGDIRPPHHLIMSRDYGDIRPQHHLIMLRDYGDIRPPQHLATPRANDYGNIRFPQHLIMSGSRANDYGNIRFPQHLATPIPKKQNKYNAPWVSVLEEAINYDQLDLAIWIIEKFHPEHLLLERMIIGSKNCTAEWIIKYYI